MSVSDLPPNYDGVPSHVHTFDDQEEVYTPLAGGGWLEIDGERVAIDTGNAVRVGATAARRPISGPDGMRLLAVGCAPGAPYEPFDYSETGAVEPAVAELPGVKAAAVGAGEPSHDFTAKRFDEMQTMSGFKGVSMTPLRRELGVSAFGINLITIDAVDDAEYPRHDHAGDGQEEVYIPISGDGEIELDGIGRIAIAPGEMIRVGPQVKRQLHPGPQGIRVIAIGGTPDKAYEPPRRPS
jgi:mannose-6-phosphate isomerase-like protein (cupin superfamily)